MDQSSRKHVLVIGAGIIGLQCAQTILEESKEKYNVSIIAEYLPGDSSGKYASAWAGAQWRSHEKTYTEAAEWDVQTYRYWEELVKRNDEKCGIAAVKGINYWTTLKEATPSNSTSPNTKPGQQTTVQPDPWWSRYVRSYRRLEASELPPGVSFGVSFDTFTIDVQTYLSHIQRKVEALGGNVIRARLPTNEGLLSAVSAAKAASSLSKIENFSAIINASGFQARELVGDQLMYPVRGQTILVKGAAKHCLTKLGLSEVDRVVVIPRPGTDTTIIGVTVEPGIEDTTVDDTKVTELLNAAKPFCTELLDEQGHFNVLNVGVGIRPGRRGGVRVESEQKGEWTVIHAYGVAGAGYQNSLGLARKVLKILEQEEVQSV